MLDVGFICREFFEYNFKMFCFDRDFCMFCTSHGFQTKVYETYTQSNIILSIFLRYKV